MPPYRPLHQSAMFRFNDDNKKMCFKEFFLRFDFNHAKGNFEMIL